MWAAPVDSDVMAVLFAEQHFDVGGSRRDSAYLPARE